MNNLERRGIENICQENNKNKRKAKKKNRHEFATQIGLKQRCAKPAAVLCGY